MTFAKHKSIKCSARMLEIAKSSRNIDSMDRDELKDLY